MPILKVSHKTVTEIIALQVGEANKYTHPTLIVPSTGSVKAMYVYGKPVDGTVVFKFGVKDRHGKITYIGRTKTKTLANGIERYQFSSHEFRAFSWFPDISGNRFVVEVSYYSMSFRRLFKTRCAFFSVGDCD